RVLALLRAHDARPCRNGAREKGNEFSSAHAAPPPEAKVHRLTQHRGALCATANSGARLPLWVISGHWRMSASCPLFPRKRTSGSAGLGQRQTGRIELGQGGPSGSRLSVV